MNRVAISWCLLLYFTIQIQSKIKKTGYKNGMRSEGPGFDWACENDVLNLACDGNEVLSIISANYGRLSKNICKCSHFMCNTNCRADRSLEIMQERCDHKSNCSVAASNKVFGDPCQNTHKYLQVEYECVKKYKSVYACEGKTARLHCEQNKKISIVSANYGRLSNKICTHDGGSVNNENCRSISSPFIVRERCNKMKTCSILASKAIFGEPCKYTDKYLEIHYECEEQYRIGIACDKEQLNLSCEKNKVLLINFANYGRLSSRICVHKDGIEDTNCRAPSSLQIVREKCSEKPSCLINASVEVFGNPCRKIWRYLEVHYECVEHYKYMSAYACEGDSMHLKCEVNEVLSIVWANYGRLSTLICPHDTRADFEHCRSMRSPQIVRNSCNDRRECTISATNQVFDDPCPNIYKYLEAHYNCIKVYARKSARQNTVLKIICKQNEIIEIINADYGLKSKEECIAPKSKEIMEKRCNGQRYCSIKASDDEFGDPCVGYLKYLYVDYKCVNRTTKSTTAVTPYVRRTTSTTPVTPSVRRTTQYTTSIWPSVKRTSTTPVTPSIRRTTQYTTNFWPSVRRTTQYTTSIRPSVERTSTTPIAPSIRRTTQYTTNFWPSARRTTQYTTSIRPSVERTSTTPIAPSIRRTTQYTTNFWPSVRRTTQYTTYVTSPFKRRTSPTTDKIDVTSTSTTRFSTIRPTKPIPITYAPNEWLDRNKQIF